VLRIVFILSLLVQPFYSHAQEIGLAYSPGRIIKHSSKLYHIAPAYSYNLELNYTHQTDGSKRWHHQYGLPKWGYTATFIDSKDSIIGSIITLMPNIHYKILGNIHNQIFIRLGTGPAIASKAWSKDQIADTINNYLGSKLNMYASIVIGGAIKIHPKVNLNAGVTLSHTSNTGIRKPNYGANLVAGYMAANYQIKSTALITDTFKAPPKWKLGLLTRLDFSAVEYGKGDGPFAPILAGHAILTTTNRQKHKMGIGLDMEYNGRTATFIRFTNQDKILLGSYAINSLLYYEFIMGKFSIPLQFDIFLHKGFVHTNKFGQRFGVMYYPKQRGSAGTGLYTGLMLKSLGTAADYASVCLGYGW
jgi:hypothetical protein